MKSIQLKEPLIFGADKKRDILPVEQNLWNAVGFYFFLKQPSKLCETRVKNEKNLNFLWEAIDQFDSIELLKMGS